MRILAGHDAAIVLAPFRWNGIWQASHYVATFFSQHIQTLYVEPPVLWTRNSIDFEWSQFRAGLRAVGERLSVIRPQAVPFGRIPQIRRLNQQLYRVQLLAAMRSMRVRNPLYWVSYGQGIGGRLAALGGPPYVYHCLDHFDCPEEAETAKHASLVFAVSSLLVEKCRRMNERTFLLPNGVDPMFFDCREKTDLLPASGQVIGYTGSINDYLDLELVERVAETFPNATVAIVGPVWPGISPAQQRALACLRKRANVWTPGAVPTTQLPSLIARFDVCLSPWRRHKWSEHCNPMKVLQYAAAGKPIVATAVSAITPLREICTVAGSPDEFIEGIRRELTGVTQADAQYRTGFARRYMWSTLLEEACRSVDTVAVPSTPHQASSAR